MPKRKSPPSPEQLRQQVDQIMANWRSYSNFGELLDALMAANGLTTRDFAQGLASQGGSGHAENTLARYRRGELDPSYAFIQDLIATNILHLDPSRLQPADEERSYCQKLWMSER